ncbi:MAG TPA: questin oxidase family protein [Usitatibacter sp.]|nr:questin oxidase family protein [Usitatibacter sp.]
MSASPAARRRIEEAHRFGAIYRGGLASHHPMAIAALDAMGASDEDLARFESRYLPQLEPLMAAVVVIEEGDEAAHLGSPRAFPEWLRYFSAAIARDGAEGVLRRWVDRFTPALAAGAFHGAIRTAFALESEAEDELAHALAYWASAYVTLPLPSPPEGSLSPHQVLEAISRDPAYAGERLPGRSIIGRTLAATRTAGFDTHAMSLDPDQLALDAIALALLRAYAASGDFTLLHGITGTHAFRLLAPYAGDSGATLADLWGAVVAAYMGAGAPAVDGWALQGDGGLDWPAIHARVVRCADEHDIKLAYSCWREWQHRGDDLYRQVASAQVTHAEAMA